ncbi:type I glyceraldehyde-3-phosphate dehydrogenase [Fretibacter rubidus]|uniref:type I glyceraldehyde-3-phosphate dehydrogenase n=1 Tax=Fretibacter rubidus TaxID=570162 RepID=UPI00352B280A
MSLSIAINGFGRIGRNVLRALIETGRTDMKVVAINDLADAASLARLLKYDSVHGRFKADVSVDGDDIIVNGHRIAVYGERDPADLPWAKHGIDVAMECTGFFLTQDTAGKHITAGAKRVLISAPAKDDSKTIVYGINHDTINTDDVILSNASCTTNALAPLASLLHNEYGIESGMMTTIHAYTGDQPTHDSVHRDPYRGRAAALSMVPTSTGAAKAISKVIPELAGVLDGVAIRVPTPNVSAVDLTVNLKKATTVEAVQALFKTAAQGPLAGVMGYVEDKLVSIDFNHDPHSTSFVHDGVYVNNGTMLRVLSWYDNEWGFSNRMLDTASVMAKYL